MSAENKVHALRAALDLLAGRASTTTPTEVVEFARAFYEFLEPRGDATLPETAAPKAPRGRKSAKTDAPAQPGAPDQQPTVAATSPSDPPAAPAGTALLSVPAGASVTGPIDIFGAPSAPAVSPTPPTASAATPSKQSSKEPTIEEVRAALTDVQTAYESKAEAIKLLKVYAPNTETTGELKKEDYAKLIKDCRDAVAARRK